MQINKLQFSGNLGADAKDKVYGEGQDKRHFVTFSVAQTRLSTRNGQRTEETIWLDCKAFLSPKHFDTIFPRLVKGASVFLEGYIELEKKLHNGVNQNFVSLVCKEFHFLPKPARAVDSSRHADEEGSPAPAPAQAPAPAPARAEDQNPGAFDPARFG